MHCSKTPSLFDNLVGADQQRCGKLETERLGALDVDDEVELDSPLIVLAGRRTGFKSKDPATAAVRREAEEDWGR
jgi:hypothetical protein